MPGPSCVARLASRAVIRLGGEDWRAFLQGLVSQDVLGLAPGEARFAALLTPQGRLAFDLLLLGAGSGCLIDCAAARREALIGRLSMYRLRARVSIEPAETAVLALWAGEAAPAGFVADPRLPALGFRGYGATPPAGARAVDEAAYEAHRLALGVPGPADWAGERVYPIEADFDLLSGIDFRKGCFVGQETTSRMKRRGAIRSRMVPIVFDGPAPPPGSEVLEGERRAGEALSGVDGRAIALVRLDRLGPALRLADGRPCAVDPPPWLPTT